MELFRNPLEHLLGIGLAMGALIPGGIGAPQLEPERAGAGDSGPVRAAGAEWRSGFAAFGEDGCGFVSGKGERWIPAQIKVKGGSTNWRGMARNERGLVAVSRDGGLHFSRDGSEWSRIRPPTPSALHRVAWGLGQFVAVGNEGTMVTSADGVHWVQHDAGTDERLRGIAVGRGGFVAVGHGGMILRSPDGRRWRRVPSPTQQRLTDVAFGLDRFVAVGWNGTILTSIDGGRWQRPDMSGGSGESNGCRLARVQFSEDALSIELEVAVP